MTNSIIDHPLISSRYFFPRPDAPEDPFVVELSDETKLNCAWRGREQPFVLMHFHGNGEVAADWDDALPPFLVDDRWSVFLAEYRGYGGSDGASTLSSLLDDARDLVEQIKIDPARIVVMGRSIGSIPAIELASTLPVAGLILESGIHDLTERLEARVTAEELDMSPDAFKKAIAERFDHKAKLAAYEGQTLVIHAADDDMVKVHHAEANVAAAKNARKVIFERGGHNGLFAMNRKPYLEAVRSFLAEVSPETPKRERRAKS